MDDLSIDTDAERVHITPRAFRTYLAQVRRVAVDDVRVPALVVGGFQRAVWQQLRDRTTATPGPSGLPREMVEQGTLRDTALLVAKVPMGAPAATVFMDECIACGAQRFLCIGAAGSLQPFLPIGALALATSAIREKGTSYHYLPSDIIPQATPALVERLQTTAQDVGHTVICDPVWTTDAPYRELASEVARYTEQGVLAVEMEAAALFAVAAYRQVEVALLLVIGDELYHPWTPGFHTDELTAGLSAAVSITLATAAKV